MFVEWVGTGRRRPLFRQNHTELTPMMFLARFTMDAVKELVPGGGASPAGAALVAAAAAPPRVRARRPREDGREAVFLFRGEAGESTS